MSNATDKAGSRFRLRRPTWRGWFAIAMVLLALAVLTAWAVDYGTLHNRVARNVTVEGVSIGRLSTPAASAALERANARYGRGTVIFIVGGKRYPMSAGRIGLQLDESATMTGARRIGRDDPAFLRPFTWLASWFHQRRAPIRVTLDRTKLAIALAGLPGQTPVREPTIVGSATAIGISEGESGFAFNPDRVADRIAQAARTGTLPLLVPLVAEIVQPRVSESEMLKLAARAQQVTNRSIDLEVPGQTMQVQAPQLRTWITSTVPPGSKHAHLALHDADVLTALLAEFGEQIIPPRPATFTVVGSQVQLVPQVNGERCCTLRAPSVILDALLTSQPTATLPLVSTPPAFTTAKAEKMRITTLLGAGLSAQPQQFWAAPAQSPSTPDPQVSSTDAPGPPSTTVPNASGGAGQFIVPIPALPGQQTNVDVAIPLLRGRIIQPSASLSLNAILGAPSPSNGFVPAEVLTADGPSWVSGGGTDLVAAALFEAAYNAGLDIDAATSPTVLRPGISPGIDATLGWTSPDLKISNPSATPILIWVDRVQAGVRVQLFGTPFVTRVTTNARPTPFGPQNACLAVTVSRSRTFADGHQATDTFSARYTPPPISRTDPDRIICPN